MRYRIEYPLDPNYLIIHVDKRITENNIERFKSLDCCEADSSQLARDILRTDGVVCLYFKAYNIYILKGEVFDWKEIIPAVIYFLNEHLNLGGEVEEVTEPRQAPLSLGLSDFLVSQR